MNYVLTYVIQTPNKNYTLICNALIILYLIYNQQRVIKGVKYVLQFIKKQNKII